MLSRKIQSHNYVLDTLEAFVRRPCSDDFSPGISYALAMNRRRYQDKYGKGGEDNGYYDDLSVHFRIQQPCYGEMRKYHETHENYSDPQPHDEYRPSDLFWEFPEGKVEGYSVRFDRGEGYGTPTEETNEVLAFLLSSESPWRRGFGSAHDVKLVKRKGVIVGFVGSNTNTDPTVLVSLLNFISRKIMMNEAWILYQKYREVGMSKLESVTALMLVSGNPTLSYQGVKFTDTYYLSMYPDLKAILSGETSDLTGKTWREGGDYNRNRLQDVFQSSTSKIVPASLISKKLGMTVAQSFEVFRDAFREVVKEVLELQAQPGEKVFEVKEPATRGCMPTKPKAKKGVVTNDLSSAEYASVEKAVFGDSMPAQTSPFMSMMVAEYHKFLKETG